MTDYVPATIERRHDLDALRASAMLAGILLHSVLTFVPMPWMVQDINQHEIYRFIFTSLHGFRMQLFFLVSGFFTAMLWRKRGLKALLQHRFRRIFLPLLLGTFTIVPLVIGVSIWAIQSQASSDAVRETAPIEAAENETEDSRPPIDIWAAVQNADIDAVNRYIASGGDLDAAESANGSTLLNVAVFFKNPEIIELLLKNGADPNKRNRDGGTPLHTAMFFGYAEAAKTLLKYNPDASVKNSYNQTPLDLVSVDWNTTQMIASMFQVELDREKLEAGRAEIARLLQDSGAAGEAADLGYLNSPLFQAQIFGHLWFLWFLCWLVVGYAICTPVFDFLKGWGSSGWLLSPARYLWLIPVTIVPFLYMYMPIFGPDTSTGIVPMPHVLLYYACFFGFGALYYDADDREGRVGRRYWITLPLALFVIYPLALAFTEGRWMNLNGLSPTLHKTISSALQVVYAWLMTFGFMGLFRRFLRRENRTIRYLSDSSYWLYLIHLPLIIWMQAVVRTWPIPSFVKLILIGGVASAFMLLTYHYMVRYTWIGRMLNGPRKRPAAAG